MKVSDFVVKELVRLGVKRVYTVPGGFSQYLNDSIGHSALQPIYCLHESGAAFAACGESVYTQKLAVCVVTSGPGSTNALTGCVSAWQDNLPVLFISGDAKVPLLDERNKYNLREAGPQDAPILKMAASTTKFIERLRYPEDALSIGEIIKIAITPRCGPVWLDIPLDVQCMEVRV